MKLLNATHNPLGLGPTLLVCALSIGLPLFWDIPGHWRLIGALQNSGHAVLFFFMAFCLAWRKLPGQWLLLALCALGLSIEAVQYFIGKDCDIQDVLLDNLGSISGWLSFKLIKNRSLGRAVFPLGMLPVCLMVAAFYKPCLIALCYAMQWQNFPTLVSFDELGRGFLIDHHEGGEYALTRLPAEIIQQGGPVNRTRVLQLNCPAQNWPGVALIDLPPNWQGFTQVQLDVWLADKTPIHLGLALRGLNNQSDHHDVSQRFLLQPGYNRVRWRLKDVRSGASNQNLLAEIDKIIIFCMPEETRKQVSSLWVDDLRLVE
ncbi:MAG TPA: VanZ family protein [Cellvibrionaceae bacterium]|nr:VanZ family protein [Cellvibrionaceae bacterium]